MVEMMPIKLHRLPNDPKERLKIYDDIILKAFRKIEPLDDPKINQSTTIKLKIFFSPKISETGFALSQEYDWFKK